MLLQFIGAMHGLRIKMRYVWQSDVKAKQLVEQACGVTIEGPYSGLVLFKGGEIIGAAIFTNYDHYDVQMGGVLTGEEVGIKISRQIAHYVFVQMNCQRCTAITPRSNIKAQTALTRLGFVFEGVMREHFPNREDGFMFGLLRSEQRLLRHHEDLLADSD